MGAAALLLAGCHGHPAPEPRAERGPTGADATPTPTPTPEPGPPPVPKAAAERAAELPLEQRVAQLFVVGFDGFDLSADVFDELGGHGWGGIYVGPQNVFDLEGVGFLAAEAEVVAEAADRIAPLVASFDDGRPPKLGSTRKKARALARDAAETAAAQGVTLTNAPFLDVGLEDDHKPIAKVARAVVAGWLEGGVAPAPSHFPGQGAVTQDPLDGPANVGLTREFLQRRDLRPWRAALREAPAVTVSSATFTAFDPVTPAVHERSIVEGLLRRELRFGGVAITDDLAGVAAQTNGSHAQAAVKALKAGMDVVFVPDPDQRGPVYDAVLRAAKKGKIPAGRIREAAGRMLALKQKLG